MLCCINYVPISFRTESFSLHVYFANFKFWIEICILQFQDGVQDKKQNCFLMGLIHLNKKY